MSRVHDALRRAEQAGVLNLENGNAAPEPAAEPNLPAPAQPTQNGTSHAAEELAQANYHPVISAERGGSALSARAGVAPARSAALP